MATPHVAGVAALVWSYFPQCTNEQIRYALAVSAADQGAAGCDAYFGRGIVQAVGAYKFLAAHPCSGPSFGRAVPQGGCSNL
jgi:serine protease